MKDIQTPCYPSIGYPKLKEGLSIEHLLPALYRYIPFSRRVFDLVDVILRVGRVQYQYVQKINVVAFTLHVLRWVL